MSRRLLVLTTVLIAVILIASFATIEWLTFRELPPDFLVGVEFAYSGNVNDIKDMVDKVKSYTNLFVIGSIEITFNQTALNEACNYIIKAGLHLTVLFTDSTQYSYSIFDWMDDAKERYGDMLSIYRFDELGGNQLDGGTSRIINATEVVDYSDAATLYVERWGAHVQYYSPHTSELLTADYGLYWFDYKAGYDTVLAEFGWNHSRELQLALCRGAAKTHDRNWGISVTWTYNGTSYIESPSRLYYDMILAFDAGAKYIVVFDYPKIGPYGILTEEHFEAMKRFWNYAHSNSQEFGVYQAKVAYVLPKDYGFGFRRSDDTIWGLFPPDELSEKIWYDVNKLVSIYGSRLDIVYYESEFLDTYNSFYEKLFFWNETIE